MLDLFRWIPRPFWLNGTLVQVAAEERYLALDASTGAKMTLSQEQLNGCAQLQGGHYCSEASVLLTNGTGGCLEAIAGENWSVAAKACVVSAAPLHSTAWTVGNNDFELVIADKQEPVLVHCKGHPKRTSFLDRGMYLLSMEHDCWASSPFWTTQEADSTVAGKNLVAVATTTAVEQLVGPEINEKQVNWTAKVTRPQAVDSVKAQVEEELNASGWSLTEIITLTIAVLAVVAVVAFIGFLYLKARFGKPSWAPPVAWSAASEQEADRNQDQAQEERVDWD